MQFEPENELPSEHFARSQGGLWIKAQRTATGINLLWQPRYEKKDGKILTIDANGDVEAEDIPGHVDFGESYRSAGEIVFDKNLIDFSGVELFPKFAVALMKHAARLLASGYGETPEDLVVGFNRNDFLGAGAEYVFVGKGMIPFVGLEKNHAWAIESGREWIIEVQVNDDVFKHPIKNNSEIVAFLCSTIPIA